MKWQLHVRRERQAFSGKDICAISPFPLRTHVLLRTLATRRVLCRWASSRDYEKGEKMEEEKKNLETLGGLCSHMLSSPMPTSDDPRDALLELCVRPTCAAYIVYGMIQKAAKGDTSAAKFIKEINGEGVVEKYALLFIRAMKSARLMPLLPPGCSYHRTLLSSFCSEQER